jgi:urease accessory protein
MSAPQPAPDLPETPTAVLQRARGRAEVAVIARDGRSRLARLHQSGSGKAMLPRVDGPVPEAVLLNTAGGMTGGDRFAWSLAAGEGAALTATTQAAERIYRAAGGEARVETRLTAGPGARLHWLPQETILFDGAHLRRSLAIDMAEDAEVLALESIVLGRLAMGETLGRGYLNDQWRIRRGGRLVYADALRFEGDLARVFAGRATLAGARALATLVLAAPDAGDRLEPARRLLRSTEGVEAAASAWNGLLVLRFAAAEGARLRAALVPFLQAFRGTALPRVWSL